MMRRVKRVLACLLVIATVFAFTPFIGNGAYAGNGDSHGVRWVYDSITGLHNGNAVAGSEVGINKEMVRQNLNVSPDYLEYVGYAFYYEDENGETMLNNGYLGDSSCYCTIPPVAGDGRLYLVIHDDPDGWYYYSSAGPDITATDWSVICVPNVVDSTYYGFMEDKGSLTITLKGKGSTYSLGSSTIDQKALLNTLMILGWNMKLTNIDDPEEYY